MLRTKGLLDAAAVGKRRLGGRAPLRRRLSPNLTCILDPAAPLHVQSHGPPRGRPAQALSLSRGPAQPSRRGPPPVPARSPVVGQLLNRKTLRGRTCCLMQHLAAFPPQVSGADGGVRRCTRPPPHGALKPSRPGDRLCLALPLGPPLRPRLRPPPTAGPQPSWVVVAAGARLSHPFLGAGSSFVDAAGTPPSPTWSAPARHRCLRGRGVASETSLPDATSHGSRGWVALVPVGGSGAVAGAPGPSRHDGRRADRRVPACHRMRSLRPGLSHRVTAGRSRYPGPRSEEPEFGPVRRACQCGSAANLLPSDSDFGASAAFRPPHWQGGPRRYSHRDSPSPP